MCTSRFGATAAVLVILGCGRGEPGVHEAGVPDAASDTRAVDTRMPDAAVDPRPIDTRSSDAAVDLRAADVGGPDATPPDGTSFAGCPGPEAYVGDRAWRDKLEIAAPGFRRCAYWAESSGVVDGNSPTNRLKVTLATKSIVTIAPGSYPLVDGAGPAPFALPLCFVRDGGKVAAAGTGTIARRTYGNGPPIFEMRLPVPGQGFVWSSAELPATGATGTTVGSLWLCEDDTCAPGEIAFHVTCRQDGLTAEQHRVVFDGGEVALDVAIDRHGLGLGTEYGEFNRARGSYRGVAFDQSDYFRLIYSPEHHHFVRHFAVLFEAPIDGACGLEIVNLAGGSLARTAAAFSVDCQLNRLAQLKVISVMF